MQAPALVAQALVQARALGVDRLDAQLLLAQATGRARTWLIAHDEAPLTAAQAQAFMAACQGRAEGRPLAYLLGEREFHGLMLQVNADVLVPRPETEVLVDWALELLATEPSPPNSPNSSTQVLDLGTGSGAIALALAHARPALQVCASDVSAQALRVAADNAQRLGLGIELRLGAWWAAVPGRRFDLVVSNPPYIAQADPHLPALRHEPSGALVSGLEGLDAIRDIVAGAPQHLQAGAWLLLEHGWDQAPAVRALLAAAGFVCCSTRPDLAGHARCTGARWPDQG